MERRLKSIDIDKIRDEFHDLEDSKLANLTAIMPGKSIGYTICHAWFNDGQIVLYNGKIEKIKMKTKQCVVAYWPQNETYEDAVDFNMSIYELAADLILDDLTI